MTQNLRELKLLATELNLMFKAIEVNSNVLTRYAMPSRNKINFLDEQKEYYLSSETQDIFEFIGNDLLEEIKVFRGKITELENLISTLSKNENKGDLNTVEMLNKILNNED